MGSPRPEGAALFVGGYGPVDAPGLASSTLHALGQIGETLLATATPWRVRRLSLSAGDRHTPSRVSLKRHLDELAEQPVAVAVFAIAGVITHTTDGPALVTGSQYLEYPEDATLSLTWIRSRLQSFRAQRLLVLLSARPLVEASAGAIADAVMPIHARTDATAAPAADAGDAALADGWLRALATGRGGHAIAADAAPGWPAIEVLLAGLCGEALDPGTGTITMRSISEHLTRRLPGLAIQTAISSETLASSPPLAGMRDARLGRMSRLAGSVASPIALEPEDLTGVVLPGRFRIDSAVATGSFGAIYRARQLAVDRDVAIKVLRTLDPASEDGRLFVQEIQGVGRIDHPNVVRIYQADITAGGRLFFAMELLAGRDLQQIINDDGVLEPRRAVELTRQLLAGLGAAHDAGLVHADVKPANAFVVAGREHERLVLLDFGLARLRLHGEPALSAGGTPSYMAPEQLHDERVDARSDLFAAALVLVTMLIGWRRTRAEELVPPLERIEDGELRQVLARALALAPADRFQTAADFADALAGQSPAVSGTVVIRPPFRHLAALTEGDRGRLHGRERDVATLTEHVLYRRAVVYTAPSGTGKTSLLRAGLVPRLESLGARSVYLHCRAGARAALAAAISPGAATVAEAVTAWHRERGGKLVLILDQLDAVLSDADEGSALIVEALAFERWPAEADVAVVLSVREDFLARLLASSELFGEGVPVVRLGPLGTDGAREAITAPLTEHRMAIAPDLLEVLLADLQRAAAAIGAEMGWGALAAVYPPHLQLACSVLYEALAPGEAILTLDHYRRLGGLDAIVGEYLDRVLDTELDGAAAKVARDLFLVLVTAAHTRAFRTEAELLEIVGSRHDARQVGVVLEALRSRGLLVPVRAPSGEAGWELIHDSLVPRVLAWIGRRDLARRRAIELVRHHLRRSRPEAPSLLGRAELRELRPYPDAIDELEREWGNRLGDAWTPKRLVTRSRRVLRRRFLAIAATATSVLAVTGLLLVRWMKDRALRAGDIGRFSLELSAFDWDVAAQRASAAPMRELPELTWQLHEGDAQDPDSPGPPVGAVVVARGAARPDGTARLDRVEARGGAAFLVVSGRGRAGETCPPSIIQLRELPGYAERHRDPPLVRVRIPTCRASLASAISIPAGPYLRGGLGDPPSEYLRRLGDAAETTAELAAFRIDRTEMTNAAFSELAAMAEHTGISMPIYPATPELHDADGPTHPVSMLRWLDARAACRFYGKDLPTSSQWQKALRGGLVLADGAANPTPRRNLPWGAPTSPPPANLKDTGHGPAPVGSFPGDVSPYGVMDLAGNLQEWTATIPHEDGEPMPGFRVTRGGDWEFTTAAELVDYMAIENLRATSDPRFSVGVRCVIGEVE